MKSISVLEKVLNKIDKCYDIANTLEKLESKRYDESFNDVLFMDWECILRRRARSIVMDLGLDVEIKSDAPSTCVISLVEQMNDYVRALIRKIERFNDDVRFQYCGKTYKF